MSIDQIAQQVSYEGIQEADRQFTGVYSSNESNAAQARARRDLSSARRHAIIMPRHELN